MAVLLKPATLQKFHQALIRRKYRVLFSSDHPRRNPGPKGPVPDVIKLVVDMKRRNPRFGCVRIAQQISNTFGIALDKNVVRRVLAKYYYPGPTGGEGPSWLTFVGQMKDSLWSIDLFRVESALLRSYWVMIILDIYTRLLIGFGVESGSIDGAAACRMFNASIRGPSLPDHISTDHDPLFRFHRWLANLRILDIQEIKAIPFTPVSHPFVERLIGTLRREFLDHALFWNSADLTNKLREFQSYYNSSRVHRGINGTTPNQHAGNLPHSMARLDSYSWQPYCRGLIALPVSI
jgi:transposase InsO family protein